jgi:hypothetical protein
MWDSGRYSPPPDMMFAGSLQMREPTLDHGQPGQPLTDLARTLSKLAARMSL